MNRRDFLKISTLGAASLVLAPTLLNADDFRKSTPKVWTATKIDAGLNEIFGKTNVNMGGIKLNAPDIAENGAVIPVSFESDLKFTKIAILQDANPESVVAIVTPNKRSIGEYSFRIKMAKTGNVVVVGQTEDGVLHKVEKTVKVTIGGCGG